ncbi:MAG: histidine phosphatase family protein [Desulfobacteraceae bacterium]|nr:histidine phosphatase family protein [Desulfobacteraceae bacterium]
MKILNEFAPSSKLLQGNPSKQFSNECPGLFLLRHGQIRGHGTKHFIGRTDVALDEKGIAQALFWKNAFARIRFDRIYSSSLLRCKNTASLIHPTKKIHIDSRLNEIDMGTWDGKSFDHIRQTQPDLFQQRGEQIKNFRPPKGESFNDLYNRVSPFFETLTQTMESPTLVITHSGVIRIMLCHYLGRDIGQLLQIKLEYSHLFLLGK